MKYLMLDYFRRWKWIYLGAVFCMIFMWLVFLKTSPQPQIVPIAFYLGAFLLAFDLARGTPTAVSAMPVKIKTVGTYWWLMATVIPAAISLLTKLIAFAIGSVLFQVRPLDVEWLTLCTLFDFAYAGVYYFILTCLAAAPVEGAWANFLAILAGGSWGLASTAWILIFRRFPAHWDQMTPPLLFALIGGFALTALAYYRSPKYVTARAGSRARTTRSLRKKDIVQGGRAVSAAQRGGLTGIPQLYATVAARVIPVAIICMTIMAVSGGPFWLTNVQDMFSENRIQMYWGVGTFVSWVMSLQWLTILRCLRMLPMSASRLTIAILGFGLISSVASWAVPLVGYMLMMGSIPPTFQFTILFLLIGVASMATAFAMRFGAMPVLWVGMCIFPMGSILPLISRSKIGMEPIMSHISMKCLSVAMIGISAWMIRRSVTKSSAPYKASQFVTRAWGRAGV